MTKRIRDISFVLNGPIVCAAAPRLCDGSAASTASASVMFSLYCTEVDP
jgi:hypothetical protein